MKQCRPFMYSCEPTAPEPLASSVRADPRRRDAEGPCYNAQVMRIKSSLLLTLPLLGVLALPLAAQQTPAPQGSPSTQKPRPEDTEVWEPVPKVVVPGTSTTSPPADAIVLFDGKGLTEWVSTKDKSPAQWTVADAILTVNKPAGNIETKRSFKNYQLHLEWRIPEKISGTGQGRGNSGLFLASTGPGDGGYELQIMDSYNNPTYVNGMAGSIYKQFIPLVNPSRKP